MDSEERQRGGDSEGDADTSPGLDQDRGAHADPVAADLRRFEGRTAGHMGRFGGDAFTFAVST